MKPWGKLSWLLSHTGHREWHFITSSSFEARCLSAATRLLSTGTTIHSAVVYAIENPPSADWKLSVDLVRANYDALLQKFGGERTSTLRIKLLDSPGAVSKNVDINPERARAVILDITTLPKKFFLFAFKQLMTDPTVKDLVVCYSRAKEYPETALCSNPMPPAALVGFGRTDELKQNKLSRVVVGVGYMPLSVESLVEQAKTEKLDFIFPFPPGSPAFRRNWDLLTLLMPDDPSHATRLHRVQGMDAFEVFERLYSWGKNHESTFLPLGPKPHALGMAMAYMRLDGLAEIVYSQPLAYVSNYSTGVPVDTDGLPQVEGYCLKYDGRSMF